MPEGMWFKVDNGFSRHPKARRVGKDGRALWLASGTEIAAVAQDGVVHADMLGDYARLADVAPGQIKAVRTKLVTVRLWHDEPSFRGCVVCSVQEVEVGEDDFYFHDWRKYQPFPKDISTKEKARETRANELRQMTGLQLQIERRDGGLCRYCGITLTDPVVRPPGSGRGGDRRSEAAKAAMRSERTKDHRDPNGDNSLENVVSSCKGCNTDKGERTNAEWEAIGGRCLLRPLTRASEIEGLDQTEIKARFGHESNRLSIVGSADV